MKRLILVMVVLSLLFCFCSEEGENYKTSDTPGTDHVVIKDSGERDTILADEMGDDSSFTDSDMDVGELTDSGEIRDVEEDGTGDIKDTAEITDKEENRDVFYEDVYADASDISQDTGITDTQIEDIHGSDAQGTDTSASDYIVSPVKFCRNLANPCNPIQTENRIFATYRKDYYLSDSDYNEYTDYPLDGGRFHIAMVSSVTGKITSVFIDGENAENMLIKPKMEWYHYWPENVKAGEVVWFAFHSRDKKWDSATAGNIKIETDNGTAVNGAFEVRKTKVPLTYITTTDDMSAFLIYMQNTDSVNHVIKSIKMNAREVFTSGIACVTDKTIRAGETALIKVPLCTPAKAGEPFTVVVEFEATNPSVGVGRVIKPLFPIEAWPNSSECPVPGGNQTNYQAARTAFIDTVFVYMDNTKCNLDWFNLVNRVLPGIGDFYVLIADNFTSMKDADKLITNTSFVAAFMTGDESDGEVWDENNVPIASKKAKESQRLWSWYPEVPTYNGAKTNGNVGTFAGMADIQGIDFYVAACAPHITAWGKHPPLRGAYDYLKNTRNNHMPLPTWMYAQGLSPVWNKNDGKIHVQPDPQEIIVQGYSVMAAGGKGLMWFQMNQEEAAYKPSRWAAIAEVSRTFASLRKYLREGDITGMIKGSSDAIVEMIRSEEALIVPVIGLKTSKAPTDISCGASLLSEAMVPHWILADQTVSFEITVPDDFGVYEIFEISQGKISPSKVNYILNGRKVTVENVSISNSVPVRIFVFARDKTVRQQVSAILK